MSTIQSRARSTASQMASSLASSFQPADLRGLQQQTSSQPQEALNASTSSPHPASRVVPPTSSLPIITDPEKNYSVFPDNLLLGTPLSCGVAFMYSLVGDPAAIVHKALKRRAMADKTTLEAFIIFSDRASSKGKDVFGRQQVFPGERLAQYISDHPEYGTVVESPVRTNPNSRNPIKVWVWSPAHDFAAGPVPQDGRFRVTLRGNIGTDSRIMSIQASERAAYESSGYQVIED